jgi:uncharacterized protein YndB with AHSA1/START domain
MFRSLTITVSIARPCEEVYEFLAEPLNLPTWTVAIERIEHRRNNDWAAATPRGEIIIRYAARNKHGVLDYSVLRPGESDVHVVPLRVFANDDGTELTFTHYQRPGMSEELFNSEAEWIRSDLLTLKTLLETR